MEAKENSNRVLAVSIFLQDTNDITVILRCYRDHMQDWYVFFN